VVPRLVVLHFPVDVLSGAAGHLELGERTVAGAKAGVMKSFPDAGTVLAGFPARPQREWMKTQAAVQRLESARKRIAELERRLAKLEAGREESS
jgi:UDP-3-O-[3-hydroxymyristoyl] glucosamine N-acyltransferase